MKSYLPDWRVMLLMIDSCFPYLYLKCGATSPLGKRIPALIKKARAASLLATEAFLAASNLSCLLLSNKSIFYLLVLKVQSIIFSNKPNQIFNLVRTWFVLGSNLIPVASPQESSSVRL